MADLGKVTDATPDDPHAPNQLEKARDEIAARYAANKKKPMPKELVKDAKTGNLREPNSSEDTEPASPPADATADAVNTLVGGNGFAVGQALSRADKRYRKTGN